MRDGRLIVRIKSKDSLHVVKPTVIKLPKLLENFPEFSVGDSPDWIIKLQLYFDASGTSSVAIRNAGVSIVRNISQEDADGLENSVFGDGQVYGFIDADFLDPLPARTGFESGEKWDAFRHTLEKSISPALEEEVKLLKENEKKKRYSILHREAIELVAEILDEDDFADLELLGGFRRQRGKGGKKVLKSQPDTDESKGKKSGQDGDEKEERDKGKYEGHDKSKGSGINYSEVAFEDGPNRDCRFVGGQVQANNKNPDFIQEHAGKDEDQFAYAALMIGKETICFNDQSRTVDSFLERFLSFYFRVKEKTPQRLRKVRKGNS